MSTMMMLFYLWCDRFIQCYEFVSIRDEFRFIISPQVNEFIRNLVIKQTCS